MFSVSFLFCVFLLLFWFAIFEWYAISLPHLKNTARNGCGCLPPAAHRLVVRWLCQALAPEGKPRGKSEFPRPESSTFILEKMQGRGHCKRCTHSRRTHPPPRPGHTVSLTPTRVAMALFWNSTTPCRPPASTTHSLNILKHSHPHSHSHLTIPINVP